MARFVAAYKLPRGWRVVLRASEPFQKIHMDTAGPTEDSWSGAQHAYFSLEDKSRGIRMSGGKSTASTDGRAATIQQYGREKGPTKIVETDGGPEYEGEFHEYVVDVMKAHHEISLPNRSTNREMERAVRTGIELGRVGVYQSGLEYGSWEMATKMQCHNYCLTTVNENGLVPWQIMRRTDQAPPRPVGFGERVLFRIRRFRSRSSTCSLWKGVPPPTPGSLASPFFI